jgi:peptide deformylase
MKGIEIEMNEKILQAEISHVRILRYPDPRLREVCTPVDVVDDSVRALIDRMFELMFESKGVGLAAPQVGVTVRLFIASPTFEEDDRRVYINPQIIAADGVQDGDEGCLSFPGIACKIKRKKHATIRALDRDGKEFEETGEDLLARIFQHENDHLDGRLLVDRMGTVARLANRRAIKDLEEAFAAI